MGKEKKFDGYMHGINLGGWMEAYSDQGWMPEYDCTYDPNMITEADIKQIAEMGFDHVRLPFEYDLVFSKQQPAAFSDGIRVIDRLLDQCKKYQLNLILDMHTLPGYSFHNPANNLPNPFLTEEKYQLWFYDLWKLMAERYREEKRNVMFELINEFVEDVPDFLNQVAAKAIQTIRSVDPDRLILFGGTHYNTIYGLPDLHVFKEDPNVVYNFHFYHPNLFTHQLAWLPENQVYKRHIDYPGYIEGLDEMIKEHPEYQESYGKYVGRYLDKTVMLEDFKNILDFIHKNPDSLLYCGEFGVYKEVPVQSKRNWLNDIMDIFYEYGIGCALWTYTDGKSESFALCDIVNRKPHDPECVEIITRNRAEA